MSASFFSEQRKVFKQKKLLRVFVAAVSMAVILGVAMVPIESSHPDATIKTIGDGLWWAFQTLTTVGYGDITPVTGLGRLMAGVLVLTGAVLYGVVIAMISSTMSRSQEEFYWVRLFERIDRLEQELDDLKKGTSYLVKDAEDELSKGKHE
jgi:voltage-gated potassium channel